MVQRRYSKPEGQPTNLASVCIPQLARLVERPRHNLVTIPSQRKENVVARDTMHDAVAGVRMQL